MPVFCGFSMIRRITRIFDCFSAINADSSNNLILSGYKFPHLSGLMEAAGGAVLCPNLAAMIF